MRTKASLVATIAHEVEIASATPFQHADKNNAHRLSIGETAIQPKPNTPPPPIAIPLPPPGDVPYPPIGDPIPPVRQPPNTDLQPLPVLPTGPKLSTPDVDTF